MHRPLGASPRGLLLFPRMSLDLPSIVCAGRVKKSLIGAGGAGRAVGADNAEVFMGLVGMSREDFDRFVASGAIEAEGRALAGGG